MIRHFDNLKEYNAYFNVKPPKKDLLDIVRYDDYNNLRLSSPEITSDFYLIACKRNMSDLQWYGNTEFDPDSTFMYCLRPEQIHQWHVEKQWSGYHMLISPILLQEYHIDFSFLSYEINEALFLTTEEQTRIETLFEQIYDEYQKDDYSMSLIMAYCNLFLTYVQKCYQRQFSTREPLNNKLVVTFKKRLNAFYKTTPKELPSVNYFAEQLHLSPNYFSDLIKHQTGKSALEIIHEKIIAEAKRKLQVSNKTISEIGYELGFEYPTYFGRLFKKHTGMTPTAFRQQ